jgi:hypothetical protein
VHGASLSGAHAFGLGAGQNRLDRLDFLKARRQARALFMEKPVPTFPA